jgi:hypothetical protein
MEMDVKNSLMLMLESRNTAKTRIIKFSIDEIWFRPSKKLLPIRVPGLRRRYTAAKVSRIKDTER